jgi:hypothetical protein
MDVRRRFVFRGNAATIGGRIVRPRDVQIDSHVASSLTVAGGRSTAKGSAMKFGKWVSYASVAAAAEGLFDDVKQQIAFTHGRVDEDALTTSTRTLAEVTGLSVGDKPKLTIKALRAVLNGTSPAGSGEPPIAPDNRTAIDGVSIDRYGLVITLATSLFQKYDTRSKLLAAADDPEFVRRSGGHLFMKSARRGASAPSIGRLRSSNGTTYATIVRSIKWAGEPYPGATIDENVVTVPEFGRIFFGELLITDLSRRLTMLRLELGSPIGGAVACAEVETNGAWSN